MTRTDRIATLHADARYYAERARGHIAEADDINDEVARLSDLLRELILAARGAGFVLFSLKPYAYGRRLSEGSRTLASHDMHLQLKC